MGFATGLGIQKKLIAFVYVDGVGKDWLTLGHDPQKLMDDIVFPAAKAWAIFTNEVKLAADIATKRQLFKRMPDFKIIQIILGHICNADAFFIAVDDLIRKSLETYSWRKDLIHQRMMILMRWF